MENQRIVSLTPAQIRSVRNVAGNEIGNVKDWDYFIWGTTFIWGNVSISLAM